MRDSTAGCEEPGHVSLVGGCLGAGVGVGSLVPLYAEIHASLAILNFYLLLWKYIKHLPFVFFISNNAL